MTMRLSAGMSAMPGLRLPIRTYGRSWLPIDALVG